MSWIKTVSPVGERRAAWAQELQEALGGQVCARARQTVARMALDARDEQDLLAALGLGLVELPNNEGGDGVGAAAGPEGTGVPSMDTKGERRVD